MKEKKKMIYDTLEYYSPTLHYGAFALPNHIKSSQRLQLMDFAQSYQHLLNKKKMKKKNKKKMNKKKKIDGAEDLAERMLGMMKKKKKKVVKSRSTNSKKYDERYDEKNDEKNDEDINGADQPDGILFEPSRGDLETIMGKGFGPMGAAIKPNRYRPEYSADDGHNNEL